MTLFNTFVFKNHSRKHRLMVTMYDDHIYSCLYFVSISRGSLGPCFKILLSKLSSFSHLNSNYCNYCIVFLWYGEISEIIIKIIIINNHSVFKQQKYIPIIIINYNLWSTCLNDYFRHPTCILLEILIYEAYTAG